MRGKLFADLPVCQIIRLKGAMQTAFMSIYKKNEFLTYPS